jgi:putative tricarboxylic transport membrane protein
MKIEKDVQERWMELVVAGFFCCIGALVISDSYRIGNAWTKEGPQPGYFTFAIGTILICGALWVILQTLRTWKKDGGEAVFVGAEELSLVLKMFLPTVTYVAVLMFMGFYVSSIIFIAAFMVWQGKYSWFKSGAVGLSVAAILFGLFEIWFLVPLPKGPLEALLGY